MPNDVVNYMRKGARATSLGLMCGSLFFKQRTLVNILSAGGVTAFTALNIALLQSLFYRDYNFSDDLMGLQIKSSLFMLVTTGLITIFIREPAIATILTFRVAETVFSLMDDITNLADLPSASLAG